MGPSTMLTCSAQAQQLPSIGVVEGSCKAPSPDGLHYFSKCTPVSSDLDNLAQPLTTTTSPDTQAEIGQYFPGVVLFFYMKLNLTVCMRARSGKRVE